MRKGVYSKNSFDEDKARNLENIKRKQNDADSFSSSCFSSFEPFYAG
jgi:hypothetical protein